MTVQTTIIQRHPRPTSCNLLLPLALETDRVDPCLRDHTVLTHKVASSQLDNVGRWMIRREVDMQMSLIRGIQQAWDQLVRLHGMSHWTPADSIIDSVASLWTI